MVVSFRPWWSTESVLRFRRWSLNPLHGQAFLVGHLSSSTTQRGLWPWGGRRLLVVQDRARQCETTWDPVLDTLAHGHAPSPPEHSFSVTEMVFPSAR